MTSSRLRTPFHKTGDVCGGVSALCALLLLFLCWQPVAAQDAPSRTGELIMSASRPLAPLGKEVFPDRGFVHRGASATIFMWPADLPSVDHKANSILARAAVLQHQPGGGTNTVTYPDIREQAFYVIAGRGRFTLGAAKKEVEPGDLIFVPSGIAHGYEVLGEAPLKILLMEWRTDNRTESRELTATLVSEKLKPLTRLSAEDAGGHQGISASPFVTSQDYPTLSHRGNSSLAWIALQQYDADPNVTATSVHSHSTSEQAFYLLDGRARFVVGETEREVGPGELVYAPRHVKHGYKVLGETPVKWLMMGWSSE